MSVSPDLHVALSPGLPGEDELAALLGLLDGPEASDVLTDPHRLAAVLALGLDGPAGGAPGMAALLARVAAELDAPVALLNGVLPDVVVLAAAHGVDGWLAEARAVPLEWSPCREVVRRGLARAVPDLALDASTRDSPLVTVDGLRAYAGVPLQAADGSTVGALCVVDVRPRDDFGPEQIERLQAAARAALTLLARRGPANP